MDGASSPVSVYSTLGHYAKHKAKIARHTAAARGDSDPDVTRPLNPGPHVLISNPALHSFPPEDPPPTSKGAAPVESEYILACKAKIKSTLNRTSTLTLQDEKKVLHGIDYSRCPYSPGDLLAVRRGIVEGRIKRQREVKNALKSQIQGHLFQGTWSGDPASTARLQLDVEYEKWLDEGDATKCVPWEYVSKVHVQQPMLPKDAWFPSPSARCHPDSAYEIDVTSPGWNCGAVVVPEKNLSLRWMCEIGDCLGINVGFLTEHIGRGRGYEYHLGDKFSYGWESYHGVGRVGSFNGVAVKDGEDESVVVAGRGKQEVDDGARVRVSWMKVKKEISWKRTTDRTGSLFVVMVKTALKPHDAVPSPPGWVMPIRTSLVTDIQTFFGDAWNGQRLSDLMEQLNNDHTISQAFVWLLMLSAAYWRIVFLTERYRPLDHELTDVPLDEALKRVRGCRAVVSRLRGDLEEARKEFSRWLGNAYERLRKVSYEEDVDEGVVVERPVNRTSRQVASSSVNEEYNWIDGNAVYLKSSLDQHLQVIVAQISLEQNEQSVLKDTIIQRLEKQILELSERCMKLEGLVAKHWKVDDREGREEV